MGGERNEVEIQAAFREEVLKDLERERVVLDGLSDRVLKLERTVMDGNGHPALTVQVKELETKVDSLSKEVGILREEVGKIGELNNNVIEIKTTLSMKDKSNTNWWQVVVTLIGVAAMLVGSAVLQYLLK